MNSTINLIKALHALAPHRSRDILELLNRVVRESREYGELDEALQNSDGISEHGRIVQERALLLLNRVVEAPDEALQHLQRIAEVHGDISANFMRVEDLLSAPGFLDEELDIVPKDRRELLQTYLTALLQALLLVMATCYGPEILIRIADHRQLGFESSLRETVLLLRRMLTEPMKRRAPFCHGMIWEIRKYPYTPKNTLHFIAYELRMVNKTLEEYEHTEAQGRNIIRYNPLLHGAHGKGAVLWGTGYVIGKALQEIPSLLSDTLIGEVDINAVFIPDMEDDLSPLEIVQKTLNSNAYCLHPGTVLALLNKASLCQAAQNRHNQSACIFCGKATGIVGRTICADHLL